MVSKIPPSERGYAGRTRITRPLHTAALLNIQLRCEIVCTYTPYGRGIGTYGFTLYVGAVL